MSFKKNTAFLSLNIDFVIAKNAWNTKNGAFHLFLRCLTKYLYSEL